MGGGLLIVAIDGVAREATLFAAIWFLIGGVDDLAVDLLYLLRAARHLLARRAPLRLGDLPEQPIAAPLVIFVPAWDESDVIGRMLRTAITCFGDAEYRLYVGAYPNDPATMAAVGEVAREEPRIRMAINARPGGTTKADCLNALWRALLRDEAAEGWRAAAVILHDAEDRVHPGEQRVFRHFLVSSEAVQIPVLPLRKRGRRLVQGHYLDEFAEAHGKSLVVREALGTGLPLAGVGCAIRRDMLDRIAEARGGAPFDEDSLTEDYELGLTIADLGGRTVFARVPERAGGPPVAVRAYFPDRFGAAVKQKARWMTGIALAGWDRIGWGRPGDLFEHWMRARDRRATLAIPVLLAAYFALLFWCASLAGHWLWGGTPGSLTPALRWLLLTNLGLLGWRFLVRGWFVGRAYGLGEALLSVPRMFVGNFIALFAARDAAANYLQILTGRAPRWDKTRHEFPDDGEGAAA